MSDTLPIHENPISLERSRYLKTSAETRGERTLIEITKSRTGGPPLHFHRRFSERLEVVDGELEVVVDKETRTLAPGETVTIPPNTLHRFKTLKPETTLLMEITPGNEGVEHAFQITDGLARDGKLSQNGVPISLLHAGLLVEMSETEPPESQRLFRRYLLWKAKRARKKGLDKELIAKYCEPARAPQDRL